VIKNYLIQDFFFTDNTRVKYEANKIIFFNLLYSGGKDTDKANFLFNLIENKSSSCVHNNSQNLLLALEHLTTITCILVGEIINTGRRFSSDNDEQEFEELFSLYNTNSNMLKEFAIHLSNMYLFPSHEDKQYLMR
jgi:hypothetical protein